MESDREDFLSSVLQCSASDPLLFVRSTRRCESIPKDFLQFVLNLLGTRKCDLAVALVAVDQSVFLKIRDLSAFSAEKNDSYL